MKELPFTVLDVVWDSESTLVGDLVWVARTVCFERLVSTTDEFLVPTSSFSCWFSSTIGLQFVPRERSWRDDETDDWSSSWRIRGVRARRLLEVRTGNAGTRKHYVNKPWWRGEEEGKSASVVPSL